MNRVSDALVQAWRWVVGAGVLASILAYLQGQWHLQRLELGVALLLVGVALLLRTLLALGDLWASRNLSEIQAGRSKSPARRIGRA